MMQSIYSLLLKRNWTEGFPNWNCWV